jgi:hypothetical protein
MWLTSFCLKTSKPSVLEFDFDVDVDLDVDMHR